MLKSGFVKEHRKETYTDRNILKAIDLESGSLSLSNIEILRQAEGLNHRERGFMP